MSSNNAVRSAVQRALCVGAFATAAGYAPAAVGQSAEAETLEEITVTGTRIATQDYSAASPISTVDAELFSQTGAPTIETVLNTLPQFVPAITSTSNNPSNGGQANVALRGLDTTRTLVLLDGRRIVPSNDTGVVDLNLIPASIIENVEIITGGASAVYGSDAVAGVVNIKTREFEGLEVTGGYGETSEGDGQRSNIGVTGGLVSADGRGYVFGSFNYADRDGVVQGDRAFSAVSLDYNGTTFVPFGSSTIRQGRWDRTLSNLPTQAAIDNYFAAQDPNYVAGTASPGHNFGFNPDGSLFDTDPLINFTGDTNEPLQPVADPYSYNFAPPNYLELPLERKSFFGKAGFEISDTLEVFAQVLWADYDVDQALAPTPATQLYVRTDNPNIDPAVLAVLQSRAIPDQPFAMRKRMIESGPRISSNSYEVTQFTGGMVGELGFIEGWDWDLSASLGRVNQTENQLGNVSRSAFEELSLAADHGASICGAPIDPFGIGSISAECAAHFTKSATNETTIRQTIIDGFVTGPMFEMPAGEAQAAVGYLYKSDDYAFLPDASLTATVPNPITPTSSRVDIVGFNAQDVVRGRTISREIYAEARLPLLADRAGVEGLDFIAGYRVADHSIAGNIASYKGEFIWDVTTELGFRGGYQRAIRAPNINELFRPATKNFPEVGLGDPCSNDFNDPDGEVLGAQQSPQARALCIAQGIPAGSIDAFSYGNNQFEGLSGGNPNLTEETADTITFGAVWVGDGDGPLGNFSASIDYYQIEIEDAINSIDADVFVERCFNPAFNPNFENSNQFCQLFRRNPGSGNIEDALEVDTNLSVIEVRGIDFQVDYDVDMGPGTFSAKLVASNLLDWEQAITAADPPEQFAGTASGGFDVLPEWKTTLNLGYTIGGFDGDVRIRYVGDATDTSFPAFKLDSVTYYDLTVAYDFANYVEGLRVNAGITNLTDEEPIIYPSNQQSNTDPATYDVLGRRYFVNLTYAFGAR